MDVLLGGLVDVLPGVLPEAPVDAPPGVLPGVLPGAPVDAPPGEASEAPLGAPPAMGLTIVTGDVGAVLLDSSLDLPPHAVSSSAISEAENVVREATDKIMMTPAVDDRG